MLFCPWINSAALLLNFTNITNIRQVHKVVLARTIDCIEG